MGFTMNYGQKSQNKEIIEIAFSYVKKDII
jgi:hypothetical protein